MPILLKLETSSVRRCSLISVKERPSFSRWLSPYLNETYQIPLGLSAVASFAKVVGKSASGSCNNEAQHHIASYLSMAVTFQRLHA